MDDKEMEDEERRCQVVARVLLEGGELNEARVEQEVVEQKEKDQQEDREREILGLEPRQRTPSKRARARSYESKRSVSPRKDFPGRSRTMEAEMFPYGRSRPVPIEVFHDSFRPLGQSGGLDMLQAGQIMEPETPRTLALQQCLAQYTNVHEQADDVEERKNDDHLRAHQGGAQQHHRGDSAHPQLDFDPSFLDGALQAGQRAFSAELSARIPSGSGGVGYHPNVGPSTAGYGLMDASAGGQRPYSVFGEMAANDQGPGGGGHQGSYYASTAGLEGAVQTAWDFGLRADQLQFEPDSETTYVQLTREQASDRVLVESVSVGPCRLVLCLFSTFVD
jgi:hypothetical protein